MAPRPPRPQFYQALAHESRHLSCVAPALADKEGWGAHVRGCSADSTFPAAPATSHPLPPAAWEQDPCVWGWCPFGPKQITGSAVFSKGKVIWGKFRIIMLTQRQMPTLKKNGLIYSC